MESIPSELQNPVTVCQKKKTRHEYQIMHNHDNLDFQTLSNDQGHAFKFKLGNTTLFKILVLLNIIR